MRTLLIASIIGLGVAAGCGKKADPAAPASSTASAPRPAPASPGGEPAAARDPGEGEPRAVRDPGEGEPPAARDPGEGEPTPAEPEEGEVPAPAPGEVAKVDPAAGEPADNADPTPAAVDFPLVFAAEERMSPADCEAVVAKEYQLVADSGTDEMKEAAQKVSAADNVAKCRAAPYPKVAADCLRTATTAAQMFRECYAAAFRGRDLTVGREFKAGDPQNASAEPAVFTQHGDIIRMSADCGLLFQRLESFVGAFLLCDGQTQGPFTTSADIEQAVAALTADQAARHRMVMGIMANYPAGGTGRYRVCNSSGVCHTE